ncbi:MAG: response regulator [Candidatus Hydrogenedentes bacterium]|nr:response regulator [Candidatus Hydrogenedentota bacterium]
MDEVTKSRPHILVVDDLRENTAILQRFLGPKGYKVTTAFSGEEALEKVENDPPDVILLDLVMPGMDGFTVCQRVKHDARTRHIPVVVLTGMSEPEANVKALEMGADDFMAKPFDSTVLDARIRNSLRSKALQDRVLEYQRELEAANESLEQRIRDRTAQLARTQQVTVFSLAKLAESRDTETGEHLDRMRRYATEIAVELANSPRFANVVTKSFVDALFESSPLHDIGKVGIPDQILLKPGKLTREEFDVMKTHTQIGGDTLKAADLEAGGDSFLGMGRDIAYTHHEKWDGTGYPMGLRGLDIPLAGRICALGDVYDALTSKRPYKEAFSHEKSKEIILAGRGAHFDPDIVDAFLARERQFTEISRSYHDDGRPSKIQEIVEHLTKAAQAPPPDAPSS